MIYQLKIKLKNVSKPPVWRRILVPDCMTFSHLHLTIQNAMGWDNAHLYQFGYKAYGDLSIREPNDHDWAPYINAFTTKVSQYINEQKPKMVYTYDFGDDWIHDIVLEKVLDDADFKGQLPTCIAAKGACPPEDCGGPWGYERLKELCAKSELDEDEEEQLMWMDIDPKDIDFATVDIEYINERLGELSIEKLRKRAIDEKKLNERVELLNNLTSEFLNKKGCSENDIEICLNLISAVSESQYNLCTGRPEIWAAAFALVVTGNSCHTKPEREEMREDIYKHFGVKQAGVLNRVTQIHGVADYLTDEFMSDPETVEIYDTLQRNLSALVSSGISPDDAMQILKNLFQRFR